MEKEYGAQVQEMVVRFSRGMCTCGEVLDAGVSLCWRVKIEIEKEVSFGATARDREMGIGRGVLSVGKGRVVRHTNPLMSNPV